MFFWIIYILISVLISFLFSRIFEKNSLKLLFFFLPLGLFLSFWFREPGSSELVPIISILILENSILENHGFMRVLRPLSATIFLAFTFYFIYRLLRSKN
tara:strand:- start:1528 stop:1827 length:300 start_codon:yes stop_codon:yes gene_type:complete